MVTTKKYTSVCLGETLKTKLKIYCAKHSIKQKDVITDAIQKYIIEE